jgi:porin
LAADSEFAISDYAGVFINATFGWPAFTYMNTPNGGPAFPIGAPGARVAWNLTDWFTFQSAAFEGNIFAQNVNRHGFRWQLSAQNGYTFLSEAQFRWNHRDGDTRLPGQLKPGVWFQTGRNADALASSTGSGNSGFYLVLDQMLYREPCETTDAGLAKDGKSTVRDKTFKTSIAKDNNDQGLGCFGRISFAPADRNFISFYFDTGLTYKGLIPSRDDDTLGVGFGYAQLSHGAQNTLSAGDSTPAGAEMVLELTYQTQLTHWLVVQPDLQYVIHPGGTSDPGNAFVIGARATVTF